MQDDTERVVAYASRSLTKAEVHYSTTENECLAVVWAIAKFRPYLYGRPFRVVSDHHSLCWLVNLRDPSGRLARWSLRLQEYDITVVYRSGQKHGDADCLSRAPLPSKPDDIEQDFPFLGAVDTVEMAGRQREDTTLLPIIRYLQGADVVVPRPISRGLTTYCLRDNVLYKKNFDNSEETYLLVVPASLRDEVMQACHDDPCAGHLGFARTLARIRQKYCWPQLFSSVQHYVRSCRDCQRRKVPPLKPAGLLKPLEPPHAPFQQVGMDLLGPFPTSYTGNKWIVVTTDYLTRYAETKLVPRATATEVSTFFVHDIVLRHGAPSVLITDRGTAFTAELIWEIVTLTHTNHRKTTVYHPQTNGLTERLNRTLADMLSMYVDIQHKTWDQILPYVTFAYNTAVQETTRFTPFELVYGRHVTTPLDAMLPLDNGTTRSDTAEDIVQKAEDARQLARNRICDQQSVDVRRYNSRRRHIQYEPGDTVWVWTPVRRQGLSEKLLRRYFGPYRIVQRLSDVNYEVVAEGTTLSLSRLRPRPETVHVVRMKPYYARSN